LPTFFEALHKLPNEIMPEDYSAKYSADNTNGQTMRM